MPLYSFELHDGCYPVRDDAGVILADREQALCYASNVVRELMGHREQETRSWRLDVYEDDDERVFAIPFVGLDDTLNHLNPHWRSTVEHSCSRLLELREALSEAEVTVREARALVARSRGKPYLAAERGRRTIREEPTALLVQK